MHLHQAAEEIRNGILQKSFSLRRTLEVALDDTAPGTSLNSEWLKTLEDLHTEFGLLSDRLSPPGLEDGLPLAIHYQSQQWQADYSDWEFKLDLPDQWMVEPCDRSRVILTALDELLRSTLCDDLPDKCVRICLTFKPPSRKLSVQIPNAQTGDTSLNLNSSDLRHLATAFSALTAGTCVYREHNSQLIIHFRWKSNRRVFEENRAKITL